MASSQVSILGLCTKLLCFGFIRLISFSEGSIQDQYIGCYYNAASQSKWSTGSTGSSNLTIEVCIATCGILQTTYAILQGGNNCFCGDEFDASQPNNVCNKPCSGNPSEFCGSSGQTECYYILYAVCPVGFYGNGCDQPCHCTNQIPCNRLTGICPNGCDGNWTQATCSAETTYLNRYIGCYVDKVTRSLTTNLGPFSDPYPIQYCSNQCARINLTYAGLQYYDYCFCGEQYNLYGKVNESDCNTTCTSNGQQTCGGPGRNSVYSVCPTGSFGPNCTSQCHCRVSEICPYTNGTCTSGCKPGWSGISCNVRDCNIANGDCAKNEACTTINLNYATVTRCQCSPGYYKARLWDTCIQLDSSKATLSAAGPVSSGICYTSQTIPPNAQQGYSLGIVIGAAIGSALALAVIIVLIFVGVKCVRQRKKQQRKTTETAENCYQMSGDPTSDVPIQPGVYSTVEDRTSHEHPYTTLTQGKGDS